MLEREAVEVDAILASLAMPEGLSYLGFEIRPAEDGSITDAVDFHFDADGDQYPMIRIGGLELIRSAGVPGRLQDLIEAKVRVLKRSLEVGPQRVTRH